MKTFNHISAAELSKVSRYLIDNQLENQSVWAFFGPMGAGKTTLTRNLCTQLGVIDTVTSPTFNIINEYTTAKGQRIYHFDFYRIKEEAEIIELGVDEYFYSGDLCIIEWPEKVKNFLPDNYLSVIFNINLNQTRTIKLVP